VTQPTLTTPLSPYDASPQGSKTQRWDKQNLEHMRGTTDQVRGAGKSETKTLQDYSAWLSRIRHKCCRKGAPNQRSVSRLGSCLHLVGSSTLT